MSIRPPCGPIRRPDPMRAVEAASPLLADAMAAIHAAAFPPDDAWSAAIFRSQLRLPGVLGLVHRDGGLILVRVAADEAEILTLAVVPAARRHGIAATLLRQAIVALRDLGARALFLEVAVNNTAALALYRRAGFTDVGRRRRYYPDGSDALVLRRDMTVPK